MKNKTLSWLMGRACLTLMVLALLVGYIPVAVQGYVEFNIPDVKVIQFTADSPYYYVRGEWRVMHGCPRRDTELICLILTLDGSDLTHFGEKVDLSTTTSS